LSRGVPRAPVATVRRDEQTGDHWVHREANADGAFGWWTVRVRTRSGWQSWVLPLAQHRQRIAGAAESAPDAVVVNVVDRLGIESAPCEAVTQRC